MAPMASPMGAGRLDAGEGVGRRALGGQSLHALAWVRRDPSAPM